jgi:16S rRNA (adenine1518-N6/adenine1519-N6)-dimethyltransferase
MRRRILGQHYLIDNEVIRKIVDAAAITHGQSVLEIGCGKGALTREILSRGFDLIGYEIDEQNFEYLQEELGETNLRLFLGDVFLQDISFDVLISSLPYSQSSRFIEWLSKRKYDRAVVVLQEDFVEKITSTPGSKLYRAISVISQMSSLIYKEFNVPREAFHPIPRVGSCVVKFVFKRRLATKEISFIKRLFSHRNKKLSSVLRMLGYKDCEKYKDRRIFSLYPDEVLEIMREVEAFDTS